MKPLVASALAIGLLVGCSIAPALAQSSADDQIEMRIGQQEYQSLQQKGEIIRSSPYYATLNPIAKQIKHVAEVFGHARPGLAVGGGVAVSGSNATDALVAVNLLNAAAGNVGKTVRFGPDSAYGKVTPYAEVVELAKAEVLALIVAGRSSCRRLIGEYRGDG